MTESSQAETVIVQMIQPSRGKLKTLYVPYAAGLLQAYIQHHRPGRFRFPPILDERKLMMQAVNQVLPADIFAFSTYVWNAEYSLALARGIKLLKPQALTIFGGPHVPDRAEAWLRAHPEVDVCVHGEGERVFLQLLDRAGERDWEGIPGISWLDADGGFRHQPPGPSIVELDEIPSPYVMGVFDELVANFKGQWIAMWETNRGCPFSCTFCDWGSATASKVRRFGLERLQAEIQWFATHHIDVINCCDANFGILPRDEELLEEVIKAREVTGYPRNLFLQNAKNVTERVYRIQHRLIQSGMNNLMTLSMQSMSPEVLRSIKRENISMDTYRQLQQRFRKDGVGTYTDLLVGLPGETYTSFVEGISRAIDEGQHNWIQFYNVYVLPNAELAQPAYRQAHGIETVRIPYGEAFFPYYEEIPEYQEMVVATATLSREDWRRIRTYAWWIKILYFKNRLLQIPLLVIQHLTGAPMHDLIGFFSDKRFRDCSWLSDLHAFLENRAVKNQNGIQEHCVLRRPDTAHWIYVEDYVFVGLSREDITRSFFAEVAQALQQWLDSHGYQLPEGLLDESLALSYALFRAQCVQQKGFRFETRYNLWEFYQALLQGEPIPLEASACVNLLDEDAQDASAMRVERLVSQTG